MMYTVDDWKRLINALVEGICERCEISDEEAASYSRMFEGMYDSENNLLKTKEKVFENGKCVKDKCEDIELDKYKKPETYLSKQKKHLNEYPESLKKVLEKRPQANVYKNLKEDNAVLKRINGEMTQKIDTLIDECKKLEKENKDLKNKLEQIKGLI